LGYDVILMLMFQRYADQDIGGSDGEGRTALMCASEYGHEKAGADVHAQGGGYDNVLQAASERRQEQVCVYYVGEMLQPELRNVEAVVMTLVIGAYPSPL
jgi:hypothetical protein